MKPYCMLTYYILILTITFFIACKKDKKNEKPLTFRSDSNTVAVDSLAQNNAGISTAGSLVDAFKGPEQYFEMANQMFITQQMSSAATEIKQATQYLDKEIKKSKNPKALQSAKKQLEFLVEKIIMTTPPKDEKDQLIMTCSMCGCDLDPTLEDDMCSDCEEDEAIWNEWNDKNE